MTCRSSKMELKVWLRSSETTSSVIRPRPSSRSRTLVIVSEQKDTKVYLVYLSVGKRTIFLHRDPSWGCGTLLWEVQSASAAFFSIPGWNRQPCASPGVITQWLIEEFLLSPWHIWTASTAAGDSLPASQPNRTGGCEPSGSRLPQNTHTHRHTRLLADSPTCQMRSLTTDTTGRHGRMTEWHRSLSIMAPCWCAHANPCTSGWGQRRVGGRCEEAREETAYIRDGTSPIAGPLRFSSNLGS